MERLDKDQPYPTIAKRLDFSTVEKRIKPLIATVAEQLARYTRTYDEGTFIWAQLGHKPLPVSRPARTKVAPQCVGTMKFDGEIPASGLCACPGSR